MTARRDAPIGVFDSGVGGLTVARALLDQMPHEEILYVGDTARTPYGPQPIARVREMALEIMDYLVGEGVKLLVVACNSASAACLNDARERYDIPVVEVIRPAVRRAAAATRSGRVGVIGTPATITSGAYDDAFAAVPHIEVTSRACPKLVDFVERGITHGPELDDVLSDYLAPIDSADIDTLVLGCTHYPLLKAAIGYLMGDGVTLVDSAEETAKDAYRVLVREDLAREDRAPAPHHRFLATGDPGAFERLGHRFLGPEIGAVRQADGLVAEALTVRG